MGAAIAMAISNAVELGTVLTYIRYVSDVAVSFPAVLTVLVAA